MLFGKARVPNTTDIHSSLILRFDPMLLVLPAIVQCNVFEFLRNAWGTLTSMDDPILYEIGIRTRSQQLSWDPIRLARVQFFQVLVDEFVLLVLGGIGIVFGSSQLLYLGALVHLGHNMQVLPIIKKWVLSSVHSFLLNGKPHVGLAQPRIDFVPVEKLLVNDCLHSCLQNTVLQTDVFDGHASLIVCENLLLCERGHPALISVIEHKRITEHFALLLSNFFVLQLWILRISPFMHHVLELFVVAILRCQNVVDLLALLLLHVVSVLGGETLNQVHVVVVEMILIKLHLILFVLRLDPILIILFVVAVLLGHEALAEVLRMVDLAVEAVAHGVILRIVHHVLLIFHHVVEVVGHFVLAVAEGVPVVCLLDFIDPLLI